MSKGLKSIIGLAIMVVAVCIMVFFIFPAIDNEERPDGNAEPENNYSKYTVISTIPMGEGCDMYYKYREYPFYCEGPSQYIIGSDGEIIILDEVLHQVLVYDGDMLRFKHFFEENELIRGLYDTEEGYIVNYYLDKEVYNNKEMKVFDKNGNVTVRTGWYEPEEEEKTPADVVAILDTIESGEDSVYASLIKKDDEGNYYISERRIVEVEGATSFREYYISKYNSDGERVGYAIYDYSEVSDMKFIDMDKEIIMDENNNIYLIECRKEAIVVQLVELGQDDEKLHSERLSAYIDDCRHYAAVGEVQGDGVTWLDIKEEHEYLDTEGCSERIHGYIMEINEDEIIVEEVYMVETYPYGISDYYWQYSYEPVSYKLADDVEIWAYYDNPNIYGTIGIEDLENFELTEGYGSKIEWMIFFNEDGEVQYIEQPYVP